MNVLIVDDDKLARKGLIAVIDWEHWIIFPKLNLIQRNVMLF